MTFSGPATPSPTPLALAAASDGRDAFFAALDELWGGEYGHRTDLMPANVRALRLASIFAWSMQRDDLAGFLYQGGTGVHAEELAAFCDQIGAISAARCVREAIGLLPDRRVLADHLQRHAAVNAVTDRQPNPFRQLGAAYAGARDELATHLRMHLANNIDTLEQAWTAWRMSLPTRRRRTLAEVVELTHRDKKRADERFMDALVEWLDEPPGRGKLGWDRQPPVGRMLWAMRALQTSVAIDGLLHFLDSRGVGGTFEELEGWATTLKASNTLAYVRAAAELMPGPVPEDDDARMDFISAIMAAADDDSPFVALDRQYGAKLTREIPGKLRAYVKKRLVEVEAAFAPPA